MLRKAFKLLAFIVTTPLTRAIENDEFWGQGFEGTEFQRRISASRIIS